MPVGGNAAPKWQKFPLIGKESPRRGEPFDRFLQLLGAFYAQLFSISVSHLTRFASQFTELLLRNRASVIYPEFFHAPCRKNYALDRKMIGTFLTVSTSSITVQSLGKIVLRAPAVDAKMWLYVCFFVTLRVHGTVRSRRINFEQALCHSLCVDFHSVFIIFS